MNSPNWLCIARPKDFISGQFKHDKNGKVELPLGQYGWFKKDKSYGEGATLDVKSSYVSLTYCNGSVQNVYTITMMEPQD